jgi:hypothetical protein
MKLITPVGMLVTVALLAIYSVYAFMTAYIERSWPFVVAGLLAVCACAGTALLKPWSRFLVYLLTVGFVAKFAHSVYSGVAAGYFGFQFPSPLTAARTLAPGLMMVLISCVCCVLVFRHFMQGRRAAARDLDGSNALQ